MGVAGIFDLYFAMWINLIL